MLTDSGPPWWPNNMLKRPYPIKVWWGTGGKMEIEQIAKVCHEVNKVYCESLRDASQRPWAETPAWQKKSAISGVEYALEHGCNPEKLHENWLKDKVEAGWKWGQVKDPIRKTHPCMVMYKNLPKAQRFKDSFFGAVVEALK